MEIRFAGAVAAGIVGLVGEVRNYVTTRMEDDDFPAFGAKEDSHLMAGVGGYDGLVFIMANSGEHWDGNPNYTARRGRGDEQVWKTRERLLLLP